MSRATRKNRPIVCLACNMGGENGPLHRMEVYHHGGACGSMVRDGFIVLQAYLTEAREVKVPEVVADTGISVASGYTPK